MKIRHLLVVAAAAGMIADAAAFEWEPAIQQPNPFFEVTQAYQLEAMRFITDVPGVVNTEVMPKWIDEDGNEIVAVNCIYDPSWAPGDFTYSFNFSDFKGNGEYILCFPEGMLVNGSGELSDKIETPYTVEIPELAGAMFDDFEVLSVSPDFSEVQSLWSDQVVTINTNHNEAIGFVVLQIFDDTTGEGIVFSNNMSTGRTLGDSSAITWEVAGTYKFLEDHQYTAEFVLYNGVNDYTDAGMTPVVARLKYTFTGKVEGYKYSSETLLSITPAPYTLTISEPSQAVFTYEFSGPVTVYKAETPQGMFGTTVYPQSCLSSNEEKTVWTLDLSDNDYVKTVDADLAISIYVRDMEGYQLKGDFGEEGESCFTASWQCDLGAKGIVVASPENGETLDRLSEIVVKSESGEEMTWSWVGEAYVQNLLGQNIAMLILSEEETDGAATEFHFTKWVKGDDWEATPIDLVAEGSYVIYFGPGCFVFGEEFSAVNSRSVYSGFQITGALDEPDPGVDPAEQEVFIYDTVSPEAGSTVTSLNVIKLTYPEYVNTFGKDAVVYNMADQSVVTEAQVLYDFDDWNVINVELMDPVTEAGEYEIVIPSRAIGTDEFFESDGKKGICNPEIRLVYTVDPNGSDTPADPQEALEYKNVIPEIGSKVKSLDTIILTFAEPVTCDDFDVNVYDASKAIVATGIGRTDISDPDRIVVVFDKPIAEAGEYDVVIPNHVIINGDYYESDGKEGLCNPEYHLNYTVEAQVPDDPAKQEVFNYTEVDPVDGATLDELSHISLWFPDLVVTLDDAAYIYKADAVDAEPLAKATVGWDFTDDFLINVDLAAPISEKGDYVVVIPARTICDDAFFSSEGQKGICNPEIRLHYTVGGMSVDSVAEISDCDVFDLQGKIVLRKASYADIKNLAKGIYIVGGKKLVIK